MMRTWLMVVVALLVGTAVAQNSGYSARPRGKTTVGKSEYTVGYGANRKVPRNYDQYYYGNSSGYELSPYLLTNPQYMPRAITPVQPYSATEYSKIVQSALDSQNVAAASSTQSGVPSIIRHADGSKLGGGSYQQVQTRVLDVRDRGILVVESREEIRLRGLRIASEKSNEDVVRLYAREAAERLRQLTQQDLITLTLDNPLRDKAGSILVVATLRDGTELNQLLLAEGLAQLVKSDFSSDVNFDPLIAAEQDARANKRGIWSRRFGQN